jgi:hypothetical protein
MLGPPLPLLSMMEKRECFGGGGGGEGEFVIVVSAFMTEFSSTFSKETSTADPLQK